METKGLVILVQGAPASGKSQLLNWHTQGRPLPSYNPTVEDEYAVGELVLAKKRVVTFLDTGGHSDCAAMLPDWVSRAQAQMLVLNLEDPASLEYLKKHSELLANAKPRILGGILIGNLPSGDEANRKIHKQEALDFAASCSWAQFSYVETNTRNGENVEAAIAALMESIGKVLSGAERAISEDKAGPQPQLGKEATSSPEIEDIKTWALELKMSKEAIAVVSELTFEELEVIFASDIAIIKTELHEYGVTKASDRNKLIAAWNKRKTHRRQQELDRVTRLETSLEEQKKQLQAATARIESLEAQLSDASWTHRIQELFLKQLQSIGWTKGPQSEGKPEEEVTPIKSKPVRGRKFPSGRGPLFSSPSPTSTPTK